jgi:hypothetical protein
MNISLIIPDFSTPGFIFFPGDKFNVCLHDLQEFLLRIFSKGPVSIYCGKILWLALQKALSFGWKDDLIE